MNEVWIYDAIGKDYVGGCTAESVRDQLAKFKSGRVLARVNSPGGDVFEAVTMHTLLSQYAGGVDVQIDGLAASAASYLATVGRRVTIASDGMLMVHRAWAITIGDDNEHFAAGDVLHKITETLIGAYVRKSGKGRPAVEAALTAETWFTADEAVAFGLADATIDAEARTRAAAGAQPRLAAAQRQLQLLKARYAASA